MQTALFLVLGGRNAALLDASGALQATVTARGGAVQPIGMYGDDHSVSQPGGAWNVVSGDGADDLGSAYMDLRDAIEAARAAQTDAYIAGALWLQGETDTDPASNGLYGPAAEALFVRLWEDVREAFPIVVVGLSEFQQLDAAGRNYIRGAQQQLAQDVQDAHFLDSDLVIAQHNLTEAEVMRDPVSFSDAFLSVLVEDALDLPVLQAALGLGAPFVLPPTPGSLIVQKSAGLGSIVTPGGQMLSTDRYGVVAPPAAPEGQSLPRLSGVQRVGQIITVDDSMLSNVTARQWFDDGVALPGETGVSVTAGMMQRLSCEVHADEGVLTSPVLRILHAHEDPHHTEMEDHVLALMGHGAATHIAIADGDWSDAATWDVAEVPGAGARVLIPEARFVNYDGVVAPRLDRLRIDGTLSWALDRDTNLLVETIVVSPPGALKIGDAVTNRLSGQVRAEITFSNRSYGALEPGGLDLALDPQLVGRGLVCLGQFTAFGHHRTPWLKTATDSLPKAGDVAVTLAQAPTGWGVGDRILIPGTASNIDNDGVNTRYDEERVITNIAENVISFAEPLIFDHDGILGPLVTDRPDLALPIAVKERNIIFRSEAGAAVHQRAHVMVMHGASQTDLWDVAFVELGRTDKSIPAGVIDQDGAFKFVNQGDRNIFQTVPLTAEANIQGRYPIHLHFVGFKKPVTDLVRDCYIEDARGWAAVHHGCQSDWISNVIYRFQGAGLVGETGDELGAWRDNLIFGLETITGDPGHPKGEEEDEGLTGDVFRRGYAFAWRGRAMVATGNIAVGCAWGFNFYHRNIRNGFADVLPLRRENVDVHDLGWLTRTDELGEIPHVDYPIVHFDANEAIGCFGGLAIIKSLSQQGHDLNIIISNFRAWGAIHGVGLDYIGTYLLQEIDLIATVFRGARGTPGNNQFAGITMTKTNQIAFRDITTRGFRNGLRLDITQPPSGGNESYDPVINPKFMILRHNSMDDQEAIGGTTEDFDIFTKYLPADTLDLPRPVIHLPFILGEYLNHNEPIQNIVSGTKDDTVSNGAPIPKGFDNAGLLHGFPNGGRYSEDSARLRLRENMQAYGYHEYQGDNIVLVPLYFSDRLTGRSIKRTHAVRITGPVLGPNNGPFIRSAVDPTANDITRVMSANSTDSYNVLLESGASGEAGSTLTLGDPWMTAIFGPEPAHFKPNYGKLSVSENGDVSYTPNRNYVGLDRWLAYAYDGRGRWVTIEVSIDVQPA